MKGYFFRIFIDVNYKSDKHDTSRSQRDPEVTHPAV